MNPKTLPSAPGRPTIKLRPTCLTRVPLHLLENAVHLGVDRRALMSKSGISAQDLKDPDGRVPSMKVWWLWQELIRRHPDPALGIKLAEAPHAPSWFGLVGYTLLFSRTVGQALHRLARYSRIVAETVQLTVETRGDRTRVAFIADPQFELLRHPIDSRLASLLTSMRELSGKPLRPLAVDLPYPKLRDASAHRRFFRAPLHFNASRAALHLSTRDLDLVIVRADDALVSYLDRLASAQLKELGAGVMSERAGRVLWFELSDGNPSLPRIAAHLGISSRSLQRHLQDEGKTFRALVEELRREMAVRLVSLRKLSVHEVAFLLGYSESSSFHRAFRRWYRTSPRAFHKTR